MAPCAGAPDWGTERMTDRRSIFDASCEDVHRFLEDCVTSELPHGKLSRTARMKQWLQEQLSEKCPVSRPKEHSQSWLLDRIEAKVLLETNRSIGEALSDPQSSLEVMRGIKERYKEWARNEGDKSRQHVYTAIYFGAIARSLVSHHQTITEHPHDYLIHSFEVLRCESWVLSSLQALYLEAKHVCERAT